MRKKIIVIGDKIVNSTPDLAYPLTPVPQEGRNIQNCTLLFVVEVFDEGLPFPTEKQT